MGLQAVLDSFHDEVDVIEASFHSCSAAMLAGFSSYRSAPLEDGCLVALWDAWARFLRDAVLTSAQGPTSGLSGSSYVPQVARTAANSLAHLKARGLCGTYDEPTWHSTQVLSSVVQELDVPNRVTIISGLGVTSVAVGAGSLPNPLEEIRACRNFVAHKTAENRKRLQKFGALAHPDLKTHLRFKRQGAEHFVDLTDALRQVAAATLN